MIPPSTSTTEPPIEIQIPVLLGDRRYLPHTTEISTHAAIKKGQQSIPPPKTKTIENIIVNAPATIIWNLSDQSLYQYNEQTENNEIRREPLKINTPYSTHH